jgi:hypothetical protein
MKRTISRNTRFLMRGLVILAGAGVTASANINLDPYIQNRGFEASTSFANSCGPSPLCSTLQQWNTGNFPNWTVAGTGGDYRPQAGTSEFPGQFDPAYASQLTNNNAFINPLSGLNVGWLQPGAYMYQPLNLLAEGTTYTVDYAVGRRFEQGPSNFQITATAVDIGGPYIMDGPGTNTWRLYGNTSSIAPGGWIDETLTFTVSGDAIGKPLTIWLGAEGSTLGGPLDTLGSSGQVNFDVTPEPALYGVVGLGLSGLIVLVRRRRQI